ncbi:hypothetical protein [Taibaiella soli]|uniref:Lipoprotein n=1 Tax=Taibaiella soli TaxID=1649169 RepID=A0A2W2BAL5_9BACT|nr:hypothetical protein [Taibaiella soli]PZF73249.1 hypothetical protein DN068_08730 [Taibaiella soli]
MKKSLLFLSSGLLLLAACNNNQPSNAPNEGQVDSMVNARVDKMQNDMQAKNDSIIQAQAKATADSLAIVTKADSMAKAMNAANKATASTPHKTTTHKTTTTKETTVTQPVAPAPAPTVGNGKPQMGQQNNNNANGTNSNTVGNGKPKMQGH